MFLFLDTTKRYMQKHPRKYFVDKFKPGSIFNTWTNYVDDGEEVHKGHYLGKFRTAIFHPGLNVHKYFNFFFLKFCCSLKWLSDLKHFSIFSQVHFKNKWLQAKETGTVMISYEKTDFNFEDEFVRQNYAGREDDVIYQRYMNIVPKPQHLRFKRVDQV